MVYGLEIMNQQSIKTITSGIELFTGHLYIISRHCYDRRLIKMRKTLLLSNRVATYEILLTSKSTIKKTLVFTDTKMAFLLLS